MTSPQDAPAGPVLGEAEHKAVQQAVFDAVMDHYRMDPDDGDDQDEMGTLVLDIMDRARPIVASLLSSAREEGREEGRGEERERCGGELREVLGSGSSYQLGRRLTALADRWSS